MEITTRKNAITRIIAIFMVLCLAFCFTACGPAPENKGDEDERGKTVQEVAGAASNELDTTLNNFTANIAIKSSNKRGELETTNAIIAYDGTNFSVQMNGTTYLIIDDVIYEVVDSEQNMTITTLSGIDSWLSPVNLVKEIALGLKSNMTQYGQFTSDKTKVEATENGYKFDLSINANQIIADKIAQIKAFSNKTLYNVVNEKLPAVINAIAENYIESIASSLNVEEDMARQIIQGMFANIKIDELIKAIPTFISNITLGDLAGNIYDGQILEVLNQIAEYANVSTEVVQQSFLTLANLFISGGDEEGLTVEKIFSILGTMSNNMTIGGVASLLGGDDILTQIREVAVEIDEELATLADVSITDEAETILNTKISAICEYVGLDLEEVRDGLAYLYEPDCEDLTARVWLNNLLEEYTYNEEEGYSLTVEDIINLFVGLCDNINVNDYETLGEYIEEETGVSLDDVIASVNALLDSHITTVINVISQMAFGMNGLDIIDAILDDEEPLTIYDILKDCQEINIDYIYDYTEEIDKILAQIAEFSCEESLDIALGATITEAINYAFDVDFDEVLAQASEMVCDFLDSYSIKDVIYAVMTELDLGDYLDIVDALLEVDYEEHLQGVLETTISEVYTNLFDSNMTEDFDEFATTLKNALESITLGDIADIVLQKTPVESVENIIAFIETFEDTDIDGVLTFDMNSELKINSITYNEAISYEYFEKIMGVNYKFSASSQAEYVITFSNIGSTVVENSFVA